MHIRFRLIFVLSVVALWLSGCISEEVSQSIEFSGVSALSMVEQQMIFGPRIPGSDGHLMERQWIQEKLEMYGWQVRTQEGEYQGKQIYNIIGYRQDAPKNTENDQIIIGAHYDTRIFADNSTDPDARLMPVPGANDGASGVAILLELARVLPDFDQLDIQLVFFDAEDNGAIRDWDWILGSRYFADELVSDPDAVLIIDMIGDRDQQIYYERASDPDLSAEIWAVAAELGVESFIPEYKYSILDDHTPFLQMGLTAIDIIDFDYPYWHTTEDTLDKISADSLENVGKVLQEWLYRKNAAPLKK